MDRTIRVWDLADGSPIGKPLTGHKGWVDSVATGLLDDRPVIVSGSYDNTIRVWDPVNNSVITNIDCEAAVHDVQLVHGDRLAIATRGGLLMLRLVLST